MLFAIIGLMAATPMPAALPAPVEMIPGTVSWRAESAWLGELSPDEQTIALLLIRNQLNDALFRCFADSAAKTPSGLRWVLGVEFYGNMLLSKRANRSPIFAAATRKVVDGLAVVISGRAPLAAYQNVSQVGQSMLMKSMGNLRLEDGVRVQQMYQRLIDRSLHRQEAPLLV